MNPFLIMTIIVITILLLFFILFITLFLGSILIFRRGGDPSSFLIPILTSLADFLTPLILIILIIIFI
jgi:cation transporter-like permease